MRWVAKNIVRGARRAVRAQVAYAIGVAIVSIMIDTFARGAAAEAIEDA